MYSTVQKLFFATLFFSLGLLCVRPVFSIVGDVQLDVSTGGQIIGSALMTNKFTDAANTDYYLDPAAATTSLTVAGSVGIGTTGPSKKLEVFQDFGVSTQGDLIDLNNVSAGVGAGSGIRFRTSGNSNTLARISVIDEGSYGGGIQFRTNSTGGASDTTSEKVRIDKSGNVGIGTTAPATKLHVYGETYPQFKLEGASTHAIMDLYAASSFQPIIRGYINNVRKSEISLGDDFGVYVNDGYRIYIPSSGNVGIGTTGPATKLDVNGTATVRTGLDLRRSGSAQSGINWYDPTFTSWSTYMCPPGGGCGPWGNITAPSGTLVTSWALRNFIENVGGYGWTWESGTATGQPTVVAEIRSSDGTFRTASDVYTHDGGVHSNSDIRLKDVTGSYTRGLVEILNLKPIEFHYKVGNELGLNSTEQIIGLSAQEVKNLIPEAVEIGDKGYLSLTQGPIVYALVNAVKEQQGQIASQQKQNDAQQKQNDDQQKQIDELRALIKAK